VLRLPLRRSLASDFAREHRRLYGFLADSPLECVGLTARVETPAKPFPAAPATAGASGKPTRRIGPIGKAPIPVFRRAEIGRGVEGPAVIEEATATTLVPAGCRAEMAPVGLMLRATGKSFR
jgi:N-methylhydantoinase A/oxoprolinase/acetone carboxylase beta subunit